MNDFFWQTLPKPMIGLSPMDGVTDAAFRFIAAKTGHPDILFTEFTHVEGICRGIPAVLRHLQYNDIERPIVAQVFGHEPIAFYKAAHIIGTLGFDGIDINMGCPDRAIAAQGCGAALIQKPKQAQEIIRATQKGVRDFSEGTPLEKVGLSETTCHAVRQMASKMAGEGSPTLSSLSGGQLRLLPVSVKTRLGYDDVVIEGWMDTLLEMQPVAITIHGRTLKQGYRGNADWEAIGRATEMARTTQTLLLGNGDILTPTDAFNRITQYSVDGVLVGRGAMGNPWFFRANDAIRSACLLRSSPLPASLTINPEKRWEVALEHAELFDRIRENIPFSVMRKQLGWYARGKEGALRSALVRATTLDEVRHLLRPVLSCV